MTGYANMSESLLNKIDNLCKKEKCDSRMERKEMFIYFLWVVIAILLALDINVIIYSTTQYIYLVNWRSFIVYYLLCFSLWLLLHNYSRTPVVLFPKKLVLLFSKKNICTTEGQAGLYESMPSNQKYVCT